MTIAPVMLVTVTMTIGISKLGILKIEAAQVYYARSLVLH
jgi:hypothetical protein